MTITQLFNETLGKSALVIKSLYFQNENKLVRFADHKCNWANISENNEGVEEVLLVFVNANMTEKEMQSNVEEIETKLNVCCDYVFYESNDDLEYIKRKINSFLS